MSLNDLIPMVLGGVAIVPHAGPIRQRYEPIGGSSEIRLSGGAGVKMTHWRRSAISSGSTGHLDPGLELLDYSQPLELLCVKNRAMNGTGTEFVLPPAAQRRGDVAPWGLALVGERWIETDLVMTGDTAQLAVVAGASSYRVCWLPRFVVFTDGVVSEFDESTGLYDWTLEAREV